MTPFFPFGPTRAGHDRDKFLEGLSSPSRPRAACLRALEQCRLGDGFEVLALVKALRALSTARKSLPCAARLPRGCNA